MKNIFVRSLLKLWSFFKDDESSPELKIKRNVFLGFAFFSYLLAAGELVLVYLQVKNYFPLRNKIIVFF
jgi:hypothetical protein